MTHRNNGAMLNALSIVLFVIFVLEAVVIIIGNTFTIFVFWTQKLHHKTTCFLLINLAFADLLVGISEAIILGTEKIPTVHELARVENGARNPSSAFIALGSSTSVFFLALISLERVYAVLWPFRHRIISTRTYIYSIVIVWVFALCMTGLPVLSLYYHTILDGTYVAVTMHSFFLIALCVICASYLIIRTRLRCTTPESDVHYGSRERNLQLSCTFFIVVALSLVFWLPAFVVYTTREL